MASLHITGNVIDLKWFKHLKLENGKPDSLGILLLGDIVYWYRPIEVRDEETGLITGYRKKFAADKLQRSYGAFADAYGYTKDQVKDALKRLEDIKLIDLDFRHPTINGQKLGNVLYIGLNVDKLVEISAPLPPLNGTGYADKSSHPLPFKDDTNTETTPETTPDSEIDKKIFTALTELTGGLLNTDTPRVVDVWKEKHPFERIMQAIDVAKSKGRKPVQYVDSILIGWEANGYPKTREERVNEKRKGKQTDADKQANGGYTNPICPDCFSYPCQCEDEA